MQRVLLIGSCFMTLALLPASEARASVVWVGDFETADLSQWTFVANGQVGGVAYAYPQTELVAEGSFAGWIELHDDAVWPNGLRRVELQHLPEPSRTAEGATTYFAWSFYLPQALPSGTNQAIGYWESHNSWQQVMAFNVQGQDIVFATRRPANVVQWQMGGVATPGQWHRIAMGVTWSTDPEEGSVSVWFDGELVVDEAGAQTLADGNPHFVQLGLLRDAMGFDDVPVIVLDDAVEGDALEDVRPDDLPSAGGEDGGGSDDGAADDGTADDGMADDGMADGGGSDGEPTSGDGLDTSGGGPQTGGPSSPTSDGATADTMEETGGSETEGAGADEQDAGCGCRSVGSGTLVSWAGLLALVGWRRRACRRP